MKWDLDWQSSTIGEWHKILRDVKCFPIFILHLLVPILDDTSLALWELIWFIFGKMIKFLLMKLRFWLRGERTIDLSVIMKK